MESTSRPGTFFISWLRNPLQVGAVAPSGSALARAMARGVGPGHEGLVVELGPGTGSLTGELLATGLAPDRLVLVEKNLRFCEILCERYPGVRIIRGGAETLRDLLTAADLWSPGGAQAVVSGLPLLSMSREVQETILAQSHDLLSVDGRFVQFTYSLGAPASRSAIAKAGFHGRRVAHVWSNLPPAWVWYLEPEAAFATSPADGRSRRLASDVATGPVDRRQLA